MWRSENVYIHTCVPTKLKQQKTVEGKNLKDPNKRIYRY